LDLGADGYIEKPFGIGELIARIRTALRHCRAEPGVPAIIEVDGLVVDTQKSLVSRHDAAVR